MTLNADAMVARMIAAWPNADWPDPGNAPPPAIITTPARPTETPNSRPNDNVSCRVQSRLMRHTKSGVVEFKMAASALSTERWPKAMSV